MSSIVYESQQENYQQANYQTAPQSQEKQVLVDYSAPTEIIYEDGLYLLKETPSGITAVPDGEIRIKNKGTQSSESSDPPVFTDIFKEFSETSNPKIKAPNQNKIFQQKEMHQRETNSKIFNQKDKEDNFFTLTLNHVDFDLKNNKIFGNLQAYLTDSERKNFFEIKKRIGSQMKPYPEVFVFFHKQDNPFQKFLLSVGLGKMSKLYYKIKNHENKVTVEPYLFAGITAKPIRNINLKANFNIFWDDNTDFLGLFTSVYFVYLAKIFISVSTRPSLSFIFQKNFLTFTFNYILEKKHLKTLSIQINLRKLLKVFSFYKLYYQSNKFELSLDFDRYKGIGCHFSVKIFNLKIRISCFKNGNKEGGDFFFKIESNEQNKICQMKFSPQHLKTYQFSKVVSIKETEPEEIFNH